MVPVAADNVGPGAFCTNFGWPPTRGAAILRAEACVARWPAEIPYPPRGRIAGLAVSLALLAPFPPPGRPAVQFGCVFGDAVHPRPNPRTSADLRKGPLAMSTRVLLRHCRASLVGLFALAMLASSAFAQALDTPLISVDRAGFFRIDLDVQAGASGAPNGFVIQWMKKSDFDVLGWPANEYDAHAAFCDFTGVPTLNPDPRSSSFELSPSGAIQVQMGDLFDETGVYGS